MDILRGVVHAVVSGTNQELRYVRKVLSIDNGESYLNKRGEVYSGLIDFIKSSVGDKFKINVAKNYEYTHPKSIFDIKIPPDFIPFDDPSHTLRSYQIKAAVKAIFNGRGVIEMATGAGKSEVFAVIAKYLLDNNHAKQVFFIVETRFLMNQAAERFQRRGLKGVRKFGGGNKFKPGAIQVCVVDSLRRGLAKNLELSQAYSECDVICFDEAHHGSAKTWVHIAERCPARYRYGLTATLWSDPFKYSHSDFKLIGLTGQPIACIPSIVLRRKGYLAEPYVTMVDVKGPPVYQSTWAEYYQTGIVEHPVRNSYVISLSRSLYEGGYKTLVFVKFISHGLSLVKTLRNLGVENVCFVKGGEVMFKWLPSGRWEKSTTSIELLAEMVRDEPRSVVVGTSVLDEGIDIPSFNSLVMGSAMMKYRRSLQRIGRGMRPKKDDNSVYIFDFMDGTHDTLMRHSNYRVKTYELEQYEISPTLLDTCDRMGIPILLEGDLYKFERHTDPAEERTGRTRRRRKRSRKYG